MPLPSSSQPSRGRRPPAARLQPQLGALQQHPACPLLHMAKMGIQAAILKTCHRHSQCLRAPPMQGALWGVGDRRQRLAAGSHRLVGEMLDASFGNTTRRDAASAACSAAPGMSAIPAVAAYHGARLFPSLCEVRCFTCQGAALLQPVSKLWMGALLVCLRLTCGIVEHACCIAGMCQPRRELH